MMRRMNAVETIIYNEGERLIPWVTHSEAELVRHRSSYEFFKAVIEKDVQSGKVKNPVILDLGFGTGHGCLLLSRIPGSKVIGIDNSDDCKIYADRKNAASNIQYIVADIAQYLKTMQPVDYILSRGVIEHVPDGINECLNARFTARLMFDVPYREPAGVNPHHLLSNITEDDFKDFKGCELLFEENSGAIYYAPAREPWPNMILCAVSRDHLQPLKDAFQYPVAPWQATDQSRKWNLFKNQMLEKYFLKS